MTRRPLIEKGIPPPRALNRSRKGPRRSWPFSRMEPFDSFFLETSVPDKMTRLAFEAAKRRRVKIAYQYQADGVRIWLVPDDYESPKR